MSKPSPPEKPAEENCPYCGADLQPNVNFCTRCAKVHTPQNIKPSSLEHPDKFKSLQERIRDDRPQSYTLFWSYFSVILGSGILQLLTFEQSGYLFYHLLLTDCFILALTVIFAVYYWQTLNPQFSLRNLFHRWTFFGLFLLVPLLLVNYGYHRFLIEFTQVDQTYTEILRKTGMSSWILVLLLGFLPAITEEIALRGLLQPWLRQPAGEWTSIFIASGLFAALHFSPINFFYFFLVGVLFGVVKRKTNQLYAPMLLHLLHNVAVLFLFSF